MHSPFHLKAASNGDTSRYLNGSRPFHHPWTSEDETYHAGPSQKRYARQWLSKEIVSKRRPKTNARGSLGMARVPQRLDLLTEME